MGVFRAAGVLVGLAFGGEGSTSLYGLLALSDQSEGGGSP